MKKLILVVVLSAGTALGEIKDLQVEPVAKQKLTIISAAALKKQWNRFQGEIKVAAGIGGLIGQGCGIGRNLEEFDILSDYFWRLAEATVIKDPEGEATFTSRVKDICWLTFPTIASLHLIKSGVDDLKNRKKMTKLRSSNE